MKHPKGALQQHQLPAPPAVSFCPLDLPAAGADQGGVHSRIGGYPLSLHLLVQLERCVCVAFHGTGCSRGASLSRIRSPAPAQWGTKLPISFHAQATAKGVMKGRGVMPVLPVVAADAEDGGLAWAWCPCHGYTRRVRSCLTTVICTCCNNRSTCIASIPVPTTEQAVLWCVSAHHCRTCYFGSNQILIYVAACAHAVQQMINGTKTGRPVLSYKQG